MLMPIWDGELACYVTTMAPEHRFLWQLEGSRNNLRGQHCSTRVKLMPEVLEFPMDSGSRLNCSTFGPVFSFVPGKAMEEGPSSWAYAPMWVLLLDDASGSCPVCFNHLKNENFSFPPPTLSNSALQVNRSFFKKARGEKKKIFQIVVLSETYPLFNLCFYFFLNLSLI